MKLKRSLYYVLISELLFTILPIFIVMIVRSYEQKFELIFYNTEWSVMAIILFGQSIVKFSSGISNSKNTFRWQFVSLIISIIIVFGLVPSIIVLGINLLSTDRSFCLYIFQATLFIFGVFCYFIIGAIGQSLLDAKTSVE